MTRLISPPDNLQNQGVFTSGQHFFHMAGPKDFSQTTLLRLHKLPVRDVNKAQAEK